MAESASKYCALQATVPSHQYRPDVDGDAVEWLHLMGHYDLPVHEHPPREGVRDKTNHYVTGRDGSRDIDLRQRARGHGALRLPA